MWQVCACPVAHRARSFWLERLSLVQHGNVATPSAPPARLYRPALINTTFLWVIALAAALVALADLALQLLRGRGVDAFTLLTMMSGAFAGASATALVLAGVYATTDLTLTAAGIAYRSSRVALSAPWSDVRAVRSAAFPPGSAQVELRCVQPGGPQPRTIPLSLFARDWRTGPLADDLRRYAPHLFE